MYLKVELQQILKHKLAIYSGVVNPNTTIPAFYPAIAEIIATSIAP